MVLNFYILKIGWDIDPRKSQGSKKSDWTDGKKKKNIRFFFFFFGEFYVSPIFRYYVGSSYSDATKNKTCYIFRDVSQSFICDCVK